MARNESLPNDAELAAVQQLRAATYQGAAVIRNALIRAGNPAKSTLVAGGTSRVYGVRQIPFVASRTGLTVTRRAPMWRLMVRDGNRSKTWAQPPYTVLEPTRFRSKDGELSTQLLEGGGPGGRNLFSGARGADNIRFWFDVERGLEKKLDDLLTKDERSRLDTLRGRVRSVIPTWVAARRETLALTQQKLGDLTEIPFAEIVRIETEIGAINPITLAAIEKAFMARAVEIELNEIGDPSEPHDPELVVSDSAMGKALRAAGIPLNGFAAEPGPKTGEVPVRAAAANGGELAPLPAITSGNDVRTLRRRLGVSQKVLADAAGVNETVMSNVETGKREINPDIQLRLGIALENLAGAQGQTLT